jgi:FkbM family methyltransferase
MRRLGFGNGDPRSNGELHLLDGLPEQPLVFDVGAHHGDYAAAVLARRSAARVYCFEPSTHAFSTLQRRVGGRAELRPFALGDRAGVGTLHADRPGSEMASLFKRDLGSAGPAFSIEESVEIRTLDEVREREDLGRIDLLKIDAEGAELLVLKGAARSILEDAIEAIVFEYGGTALDSHVFLRDFYAVLSDRYDFFRVLPEGLLPLGAYRQRLEVTEYANYYCERKRTRTRI